MKINIMLDEALSHEATKLTGISNKSELVDVALRALVRSKRKKKNLFDLAGQIDLADSYDYKAGRSL